MLGMHDVLRRPAMAGAVCAAVIGTVAVGSPAAAAVDGAGQASAASCQIGYNIIFNTGGSGIGVMHLWDGVYGVDGKQKYDAVLSASNDTCSQFRWDEARGFYVGPGACAWVQFAATGTPPFRWDGGRKVGAGSFQVSANNHVKIARVSC
jgi:hypothetical protein